MNFASRCTLQLLGLAALATCLSACASSGDPRPISAGSAAPRSIEMRETHTINTFHFPRGLYTLEAEDDTGYYYRAPVKVVKQSFSGPDPHDGGIFLRRGRRQTLRGYVVWAGGYTKIGDLSRARYAFRD